MKGWLGAENQLITGKIAGENKWDRRTWAQPRRTVSAVASCSFESFMDVTGPSLQNSTHVNICLIFQKFAGALTLLRWEDSVLNAGLRPCALRSGPRSSHSGASEVLEEQHLSPHPDLLN